MKNPAKLFLIAAGCALMFTGCTTPPPTAWEYDTITTDNPNRKSVVDAPGKSGWELVRCTAKAKDPSGTNFEYQYVFKRPKQP
jgi:hypothetical protein